MRGIQEEVSAEDTKGSARRTGMKYKMSAVIEHDANGYFAYSPELKGCFSQGGTYEEALENIKEAMELYLETLSAEERKELSSKSISMTSMEISIA